MEIKFTNTRGLFLKGYEPVPAKKVIPEWYKEIETYRGGQKLPDGKGESTATIKKCMPVFDAITSGYIIFSIVDVFVTHSPKDGSHWFEWPSETPLEFHDISQAPTHPTANGWNFPKWINPWGIKTPPGYSCLFVTPFHHKLPFTIFPGVVDTDTYTNNVNFPFQMNDPNFEGLIPAKTPIVQVIPFKRDSWEMKLGDSTDVQEAHETLSLVRRLFFDSYKTQYRQPKEYL